MNYIEIPGSKVRYNITVFSLTTCPHCKEAKNYLKKRGLYYKYIDVDEATRDEKREITLFLKANNLPIVFPVIVIDENILIGFDKQALEELIKD